MNFPFYLKAKAWQLNLISIALLFGSPLFLHFGIVAFKLCLIVWNIFVQLYLVTMFNTLEDKISPLNRKKRGRFYFAILLEILLFALFIFLSLRPERSIQNITYNIVLILSIGLLEAYCFFRPIEYLLIIEKKKAVDFGDVVLEYLKIGFTPLNIFSMQKRVITQL
jgi:hypothetical protein